MSQVLYVRGASRLELQCHVDVTEIDADALAPVLDPDDVGPHIGNAPSQAVKLAGPIGQPSVKGKVTARGTQSEANHPEQEQRVDVSSRQDDDNGRHHLTSSLQRRCKAGRAGRLEHE